MASGLNIVVTGAIGESVPFFSQRLDGIKEIAMDLSKATYISSVGVKAWIMWTVRIPANCQVKMIDVPYVIVSQASMTLGFVNAKMKIESMRVPFVCSACGFEDIRMLRRGSDYEYAMPPQPKSIRIPEKSPCTKCRATEAEPDFLIEKTFKFLDV